jgi:hypothetical protein
MHNVASPITIDEKGLKKGPIPMGENQEKATHTIAATLNGEKRFENRLAILCDERSDNDSLSTPNGSKQ